MDQFLTLRDQQLAARLNAGDKKACAEVYDLYWELMFHFAYKLTQDYDEAKDIVQDAFVKLYQHIGIKDYFQDTLRSYLYTTVKNRYIDLSQKEKHKEKYVLSLKNYFNAGSYSTDEQVRKNELDRLILEALEQMSPITRKIFEYSRNEYLTRKAIAEATGLPENTIKKQMEKALRIIRSKLSMFICFQIMAFILLLHRNP